MRLFRNVRKRMLISGKIKNYLLYALGEIFLIVIGILIAWKINNLNELRKNKIVEFKIYQTLNEELDANLKLLDSTIFRYAINVETIKKTIKNIDTKTEDLSDELKDRIILTNHKSTQLHDGAINSINSTNKFEFIESVLLKDLIASYPNELENFKSQEVKIENIIVNRLQPAIESQVSLLYILSDRDLELQTQSFSKQTNYINLLNSRAYQNALVDRLINTEIQLKTSKNLRDKTKKIVDKLDKVLTN